jgi:hypothetical protein
MKPKQTFKQMSASADRRPAIGAGSLDVGMALTGDDTAAAGSRNPELSGVDAAFKGTESRNQSGENERHQR